MLTTITAPAEILLMLSYVSVCAGQPDILIIKHKAPRNAWLTDSSAGERKPCGTPSSGTGDVIFRNLIFKSSQSVDIIH